MQRILPHPDRREWGDSTRLPSLRTLPLRRVLYQPRGQNLRKHTRLKTPSLRFPLRAGGTERTHGSVPLAKRGEPAGGGQL
jgi:hypothetical protein